VAAYSKEKMFWRFYQRVSRKCHISIVRSCQRVYVERRCLYFSYLFSSKTTDNRGKINGFDSEFSSRSFVWRCVSIFVCCFRFSEFSVIFLLSKYTDCPNCRYSLRRDCKRDLKNFRHVRWKCQSFSKLQLTQLHDNLFCWKAWIDFC